MKRSLTAIFCEMAVSEKNGFNKTETKKSKMKTKIWIAIGIVILGVIGWRLAGRSILNSANLGGWMKYQSVKAAMQTKNNRSLDTYGKVIDQDGNPVVGAKVEAGVMTYEEWSSAGGKGYFTQTDSKGRFQFLGVKGAKMGLVPSKKGYIYNRKLPSTSRPADYTPDPNHPLILTMWKLKGAEPMVHAQIHDYIPCDGTIIKYNLLTGNMDNTNGDLVVKLSRIPLNIKSGATFHWTLTISIPSGGFVENKDLYPNEAPENGYQPSIIVNMPKTAKNWTALFQKSYYFTSRNGKVYGRISFKMMADFQPPQTLFDADIFANPAGSRNLEVDGSKLTNRP